MSFTVSPYPPHYEEISPSAKKIKDLQNQINEVQRNSGDLLAQLSLRLNQALTGQQSMRTEIATLTEKLRQYHLEWIDPRIIQKLSSSLNETQGEQQTLRAQIDDLTQKLEQYRKDSVPHQTIEHLSYRFHAVLTDQQFIRVQVQELTKKVEQLSATFFNKLSKQSARIEALEQRNQLLSSALLTFFENEVRRLGGQPHQSTIFSVQQLLNTLHLS